MRLVLSTGAVMVLLCSNMSLAQAPARGTPAEEAARLWYSAINNPLVGPAERAAMLEKFVAAYPTNENVPQGYLKLAYYELELKDFDGFMSAMDEVINRFQGSPAWYAAYAGKLAQLKAKNDRDGYFKTLEAFVSKQEEVPLDIFADPIYYWYCFRHWESYRQRGGTTWILDAAAMADTPERAAKVLRLLQPTLDASWADLPSEWMFAHVSLLWKAGRADEAKQVLMKYSQTRGNDPEVGGLWLLEAQNAVARKDKAAADFAYDYLFKNWSGSAYMERVYSRPSVESEMYTRLSQFNNEDRYDDFMRLVQLYNKCYGRSNYGYADNILNWAAALAVRPLTAPKPAPTTTPATAAAKPSSEMARVAPILALLEELADKHPLLLQGNLRRKFQIYLAAKMYTDAAKMAAELVGDKQWCSENFGLILQQANTDPAFAKIINEARARWNVPLPDPASKAFPLLNQLRLRLKENQVRHAEEIVEEMFAKHRDDSSTIDAVDIFAEYCYNKVLAEPRDKWSARMVEAYPTHPATQAVLSRLISAQLKDRQYEAAARSIDTAIKNFPGAGAVPTWQSYRLQCYVAKQDTEGKVLYAKSIYGPRADAAEVWAVAELARYELEKYTVPPFKQEEIVSSCGTYWLERADKLLGTQAELYSLCQAIYYFYIWPVRHVGIPGDWDRAAAVRQRLVKQTLDVELVWTYSMMDVNMLADQDKVPDALKALDGYLRGKTTIVDLDSRVKLALLGPPLGKAGMTKEGTALAKRLEKLCPCDNDQHMLLRMQGEMFHSTKKPAPAEAASFYIKAVEKCRIPILRYDDFQIGVRYLAEAKSPRYGPEVEDYIKRINRAQDLVPELLYQLGYHYYANKDAAVKQIMARLNQRYPASSWRDKLWAVLNPPPPQPKPKPVKK